MVSIPVCQSGDVSSILISCSISPCGYSTVIVRLLAMQKVVGLNPITRSNRIIRGPEAMLIIRKLQMRM